MTWLSKLVPGNAPDGAPILAILGKRTYRLKPGAAAVPEEEEAIGFQEGDALGGKGNPAVDPVLHESDLAAYKPMTDVVVHGPARTPKGKKAYHLDVSVQVGQVAKKALRVFGERRVFVTGSGIGFSQPEPFEEMPMDYTRAYGGWDRISEEGVEVNYPRNPIGRGFVVKNNPKALQDMLLPNTEDPRKLLTPQNLVLGKYENWRQYPEPQSFAYTSRGAYPRLGYAGLPPDSQAEAEYARQSQMQKMPQVGAPGSGQPSGAMPLMNPMYYNGASPGLAVPYLRGDEDFRLVYLDPDRPEFLGKLPGERPKCWLDVGEGPEEMSMVLQTVEFHKPQNLVTLVWRGACRYPGPEAMEEFQQLEMGVES